MQNFRFPFEVAAPQSLVIRSILAFDMFGWDLLEMGYTQELPGLSREDDLARLGRPDAVNNHLVRFAANSSAFMQSILADFGDLGSQNYFNAFFECFGIQEARK